MSVLSFRTAKFFVSITILTVLFWNFNFAFSRLENIDLSLVLILKITVFLAIGALLRALRWHYLMNSDGNKYLSFVSSFKLLTVGSALNNIAPAGLGDIAKGYFGYKRSTADSKVAVNV